MHLYLAKSLTSRIKLTSVHRAQETVDLPSNEMPKFNSYHLLSGHRIVQT